MAGSCGLAAGTSRGMRMSKEVKGREEAERRERGEEGERRGGREEAELPMRQRAEHNLGDGGGTEGRPRIERVPEGHSTYRPHN